jgi:HPt (histidine-containing phosphotransfer) domain-containing protein
MAETAEDFSVHRFIGDLFEDLALTLPSLGVKFAGTATANTLTACEKRTWIKNKLFLLFADIAVLAAASGVTSLACRFTVSRVGTHLQWCFFCSPLPVGSTTVTAWDSQVFLPLDTVEGHGFAVLVAPGQPLELGPPIHWQELDRLYGSGANADKVLGQFLERCTRLVPELGASIAQHNSAEVLRVAHTLKGSARGVTAQSLSHAALQLEILGRSGDFAQADQLYKALLDTYHEVTSWVQEGHT